MRGQYRYLLTKHSIGFVFCPIRSRNSLCARLIEFNESLCRFQYWYAYIYLHTIKTELTGSAYWLINQLRCLVEHHKADLDLKLWPLMVTLTICCPVIYVIHCGAYDVLGYIVTNLECLEMLLDFRCNFFLYILILQRWKLKAIRI